MIPYTQLHQSLHILHVEMIRVGSDVASRAVDNPRALVRERVPDIHALPWKRNKLTCASTLQNYKLNLEAPFCVPCTKWTRNREAFPFLHPHDSATELQSSLCTQLPLGCNCQCYCAIVVQWYTVSNCGLCRWLCRIMVIPRLQRNWATSKLYLSDLPPVLVGYRYPELLSPPH
jgi:hypothetical protein